MITFLIVLTAIFLIWKFTPTPVNKQAAGMMFQILESFNIVDSTVKLDVFTQRLDFLRQLANGIPTNTNKKKCAEAALQSYVKKYPNVPISPTARLILEQPQIAASAKFRDEAATAFFLRTCYKLKSEIATLKTKTAKQQRIEQARDLAVIIADRLTSLEKQKYIDCIHNELAIVSDMGNQQSLH